MCCNEEFLSQKSFKDECIFQLKRHLENGMRFSKVMLQDFKEYLLISHEKVSATNEKKMHVSKISNVHPMSNSSALALLAWSLIYKCLLSSSKYLLSSGQWLVGQGNGTMVFINTAFVYKQQHTAHGGGAARSLEKGGEDNTTTNPPPPLPPKLDVVKFLLFNIPS